MIKPFSFASDDRASRRTPTGRPTVVRHFLSYHNPDVMEYEFYEVTDFAVVTRKRIRDLIGSVIWCVGRLGGTSEFYLDARFRVDRVEEGDFDGFKFRVSGNTGLAFFPVERIDNLAWFGRLRTMSANFVGLQAIRDSPILAKLHEQYELAQYVQGLRPEPPASYCLDRFGRKTDFSRSLYSTQAY